MVPTAGEILQVTPDEVVPCVVAVNCCVAPGLRLTDSGERVTVGEPAGGGWVGVAVIVTPADADLLGSTTDFAVTTTVCCEARDAGAVYRPVADTEPITGEIDQVTAVFVVPVTDTTTAACRPERLSLRR